MGQCWTSFLRRARELCSCCGTGSGHNRYTEFAPQDKMKYSDETLLNQINSNRPATATVSQQAYEGRSLIPSSDSASAYNNVAADEMLPGGLAGGLYGGPMKQMPYSRALLDSVESVGLANPVHEIESLQTLQSDATCHVSDTISQYDGAERPDDEEVIAINDSNIGDTSYRGTIRLSQDDDEDDVLRRKYSRTGKQKGGGAVSPPLGAENETFSQITTEMNLEDATIS